MSSAAHFEPFASSRATLALYGPPAVEAHVARWRINGYPARILIWTIQEWEMLPEQPTDAQYYPCGVWCALRID
jgi:hypothetical protein